MFGLKDKNSIGIGPAEIRVGDYTSNVNFITPVLGADNYFGYSETTKIVYQVDYLTNRAVNSVFINSIETDTISCSIEMNTVELSKDILNLLFGIYPNNSNYISLSNIPAIDFRLEILYTYPDTTKQLAFVFPRVRIKKGLNLNLTSDAEVVQSINFIVLEETDTIWVGNEYGIIYQIGM